MRWLCFIVVSGCTQDFDPFLRQDLSGGAAGQIADAAGKDDASRDAAPEAGCSSGCAFMLDGPFTWDQARDACAAAGAHLATFADDSERAALSAVGRGERWIGVRRVANRWELVTGGVATYLPWAPDEPNGNGNDRCVRIKDDGLLYDYECAGTFAALCER
jgi:hypothetical protein